MEPRGPRRGYGRERDGAAGASLNRSRNVGRRGSGDLHGVRRLALRGAAGVSVVERPPVTVPRLALRIPDEAAEALGVSPDFFDEHVRHELRVVRRGRLIFVSLAELERWLERSAARAIE